MSQSAAGIANLALSHLGHDRLITALDDRTTEARACNAWYDQCRNEVLRDFAWPFAILVADLALVTDFTDSDDALYDPNAEWHYAYQVPDDCVTVLRLPYGSARNPTNDATVKYAIRRNADGGRLILTDQDAATLEYVSLVDDPNDFAADFIAALSHLLAARICPLIVTEGKADKQQFQLALYQRAIAKAKSHAANEETRDVLPDGPYLGARA